MANPVISTARTIRQSKEIQESQQINRITIANVLQIVTELRHLKKAGHDIHLWEFLTYKARRWMVAHLGALDSDRFGRYRVDQLADEPDGRIFHS